MPEGTSVKDGMTSGIVTRLWTRLAPFVLLFCGAGCLQIETNIVLHPDGSGTITERVGFSRKLLDLADNAGADLKLEPLLSKEAALDRMKLMGKGIRLVSHDARDGAQNSRESVAVFEIQNLADFTYIFPFVPRDAQTQAPRLKTHIHPFMGNVSGWTPAGRVFVDFEPEFVGKSIASTNLPSRSPLASQGFRDLRPVFQDLMEGLEIKMTFESYAPVEGAFYGSGWRDANVRTRKVDLIDFVPSRDLDAYGYPLLENEEVVVDFLRWDLNSPWVANTVRDWSRNRTLSALHPGGTIFFRPSKEYFQKFFEGKTLSYPGRPSFPAKWEEIGWTPTAKKE